MDLLGVVSKTIVRGNIVYEKGQHSAVPLGQLLFTKTKPIGLTKDINVGR